VSILEVYLRRLRREQLRLSLLSLVAFGGAIGALPLILYLLPALHDVELLGVPLPIWLVVVPPFPLFVAIGWLEQRRAVELRPQVNGTAVLVVADGVELPIARREVAELRRRLRA
jgi:hypothetical protein